MPTASKPLIYLRFLKSYNYTPTKGQVLIGLALFYFAAREKEDIRTDAKALNSLMIPRSSKEVNPLLHIRTLFQCYDQLFAGNLVPSLH